MRLEPIKPSELTSDQRLLFDRIGERTGKDRGFKTARADGAMLGPYNPMLHFPEFGAAVWALLSALTKHSRLTPNVREAAILLTGAHFGARYELYAHEILARAAGLSEGSISSLAAGAIPGSLPPAQLSALLLVQVLLQGTQVAESIYQSAVASLGLDGVGELVYLVGFYCLISAILNGFDVPVPGRDD